RARLEALVAEPVQLTPFTRERADAEPWLREAEGVVAKELDCPYRPGERAGMVKVKRVRTIDCVVIGWRPGKGEGTVGAIILGLYDAGGELREVGHSSGFTAREKRVLVESLKPSETGERGRGEASRWSHGREPERGTPALLAAAVPAHLAVSLGWAFVLPRRAGVAGGALAGLAIAALDLGVLARWFPRVRALPLGPQVADHVVYGAVVGWALRR